VRVLSVFSCDLVLLKRTAPTKGAVFLVLLDLASLSSRCLLIRDRVVGGSNPLAPTNPLNHLRCQAPRFLRLQDKRGLGVAFIDEPLTAHDTPSGSYVSFKYSVRSSSRSRSDGIGFPKQGRCLTGSEGLV
jgi:hypothetical protein